MTIQLFIEILGEKEIRLYDGEHTFLLTDDDLSDKLSQYSKNAPITLIDSLHIQSKTFTLPVKDKKVLSQVIAADMSEYLTQSTDAYQFAYREENDLIWVSWIEKERLSTLKSRFSTIISRIKALVSMPLLVARGCQHLQNSELFIAEFDPLTYAIQSGQTTVVRTEQAAEWIKSITNAKDDVVSLSTVSSNVFQSENIQSLPNLWKNRNNPSVAKIPLLLWSGLTVLSLLLWVCNSYWDYQNAKLFNQSSLEAQQSMLRQIFPHAKGTDPYGRLSTEYQRQNQHSALQALNKLDKLLSGKTVELSGVVIDTTQKTINLYGNVNEALSKQLNTNGFVIKPLEEGESTKGVRVSW